MVKGITTIIGMIPKGGKYAKSVVNFVHEVPQNWEKFTSAIKQITDLLKQGKPESIKSLARIDPHIAAVDMPQNLISCYVSGSQTSFPIAPLLRQLYKAELEGTQQWKNAEQLTRHAITQCDPAIPFGETTGFRKENETIKIKPLAETIIDALFPASTHSTSTGNKLPARRLSDSFLTKDFVDHINKSNINSSPFIV